jgi:phage protein D
MSANPSNTDGLSDLEEKYGSFYVPTFEINIGGQTRFSPATGQASSVTVRTALEKANRTSFTVAGVYDQAQSDFIDLATTGVKIGKELEVKLGYGSETETVMLGRITDIKPTFPSGGAPTVAVIAHDYRYFMDQASIDRSWDNTTVESATGSIAKTYGFKRVEIGESRPSASGGATGGSASKEKLKQLVQDSETDLAFLKKLIKKHNYEMYSLGGVLRFRRPAKLEGNPEASVKLGYGGGLRSYQRTAGSDESKVKKVKHRGTNPRTGETVSGSSTRTQTEGSDEERLFKAPMESDEEAEKRSESKANAIDHARRSQATTIGLPDLRIGEWLEVTDLGSVAGQTYDGTYYLREVDHTIDNSGYSTQLQMSGPIPERNA